jgi:hypothetical protein
MNPRGPTPHAAVTLDAAVLGAHSFADAITSDLQHLMGDFADFWQDREITYQEACHVTYHMSQLHKDAGVLCRLLDRLRGHVNKVLALVSSLRAKVQELKAEGGSA